MCISSSLSLPTGLSLALSHVVNGLVEACASRTSDHSMHFTIPLYFHPFMHTFTRWRRCHPRRAPASSVAVGVRTSCSGTPRHRTRSSQGSSWQPRSRQPARSTSWATSRPDPQPAASTWFIPRSCLFYTSGFGWVFLPLSIKNIMGPHCVITAEARYEFKLPRGGTFGGFVLKMC